MSEWQTMETAPKVDREHPLLALRKGPKGVYWALIYWSEKWNDWAEYWDGDVSTDYPPTHWQSLPEPPS